MKIEYDREADALYVTFRSVVVDHSHEIEDGVVVDFDSENRIVGVEVLDASHRLSPEELSRAEVVGFTG
jgi:uncharacterized protein YuzE